MLFLIALKKKSATKLFFVLRQKPTHILLRKLLKEASISISCLMNHLD